MAKVCCPHEYMVVILRILQHSWKNKQHGPLAANFLNTFIQQGFACLT